MTARPCLACFTPTRNASGRCPEHAATHRREVNRWRHNPFYDSPQWRALRARVLKHHRQTVGPVCPGWQREAHPATDLTADHVIPLAAGGAPLDPDNVGVLCRSCGSRKGSTIEAEGRGRTKDGSAAPTTASPVFLAPPRKREVVKGAEEDAFYTLSLGRGR